MFVNFEEITRIVLMALVFTCNNFVCCLGEDVGFFTSFSLQKQPPEVLFRKTVLKSFAKFTRKHLLQSLFFNKVVGLTPTTCKRNLQSS